MSIERQRATIDRLLDEAESALTDRQWPRVRELMRRVLEMDSDSARAKGLLAAAHGGLGDEIAESADAHARGAYMARASRALERKFGLEPDAPPAYPRPDRSDFTPTRRKTPANDVIDVGWAEGAFSDGRPFRVETWAQDQTTSVTIFMSALGLEDASDDQLRDLLVEEGLLVFLGDYRHVSGAKLLDPSNSEMWSVNVAIGVEDDLLTECTATLSPYPRGGTHGEQHDGGAFVEPVGPPHETKSPRFVEADAAYRDAMARGRESGTPKGLEVAAQVLFDLGVDLGKELRPKDLEHLYQHIYETAAEMGSEAGTAEGLEYAALALANLGTARSRAKMPPEDVESAYRKAVDLGRKAGTQFGMVVGAGALHELGSELGATGASIDVVQPIFRQAAELGREAGTSGGLQEGAWSLFFLGLALLENGRPVDEVESTFREAAKFGRESGTPRGLEAGAESLANLGLTLVENGRPIDDVESTFLEAVDLGRRSETIEAVLMAAKALLALRRALIEAGRSTVEVESTYHDVIEFFGDGDSTRAEILRKWLQDEIEGPD